ncbi:MAG: hypothetical protein OHK0022_32270 [Roseiflexaceae bacterium]
MAQQSSALQPPLISALQVAGSALIGFGVMLLLIGAAYAHDLAELRRVPEALWRFVCGGPPPSSDSPTLPLLLAASLATLLLGAALLAAQHLRAQKRG